MARGIAAVCLLLIGFCGLLAGLWYVWLLIFPMGCDTQPCDNDIGAEHWLAATAILAGSLVSLLGAASVVEKGGLRRER